MTASSRTLVRVRIAALLLLAGDVGAFAATTTRVSLSSSNAEGANPRCTEVVISGNGNFAAFASEAFNLVPGDTNGSGDVIVRNLATDAVERVSVGPSGAQATEASYNPCISADGRYVAFTSDDTDLVPGDAFAYRSVYLRDRHAQTTVRVTSNANGGSNCAAISADGRFVLFDSVASNLVPGDTNATSDVFVWDHNDGSIERVSVSSAGVEGNGSSNRMAGLSADGSIATFVSSASNLVPDDTNSCIDAFVRDRRNRTTERVSVSTKGDQATANSTSPVISGNGLFVLFTTPAGNVVGGDTNYCEDGFLRDRVHETTERVTLSASGSQGDKFSRACGISDDGRFIVFESDATGLLPESPAGVRSIYLSDREAMRLTLISGASDGTPPDAGCYLNSIVAGCLGAGPTVAYLSAAGNITPKDANGAADGFVYNLNTDVCRRVSAGPDNWELGGPGEAVRPSISDDGRYVAFESSFANMVPGDYNNGSDVFLRDTQLGLTELISIGSDGARSKGAHAPCISPDSRVVVFNAYGPDFAPGHASNYHNVYVRDRRAETTTLVSVAPGGVPANGTSDYARISADRRYVVFTSLASNLVSGDTNNRNDVFRADLHTGQIVRASESASGAQGNDASGFGVPSGISADGRYVCFYSPATNLVPGDTNSANDIFVKDLQTGAVERVSVATDESQASGRSFGGSISGDGRLVVFYSLATNLVSGDTNGFTDVFMRDRTLGTTTLVSGAAGGGVGNGGCDEPAITPVGRFVVFESVASNLVTGDTNTRADVFRYDTLMKTTIRVNHAYDGAQGNGSSDSYGPSITGDGRWVAFASAATNLVPSDNNRATDVFTRGDFASPVLHLTFDQQPANIPDPGALPAVKVALRESGGGALEGYGGVFSLSLKPGTGTPGATLGGVVHATALDGLATFSGLTITPNGAGYVLVLSCVGVASAESAPFHVGAVPYAVADIRRALSVASGSAVATTEDGARLDLVTVAPAGIDLRDAVRVARKAAGLEPNP